MSIGAFIIRFVIFVLLEDVAVVIRTARRLNVHAQKQPEISAIIIPCVVKHVVKGILYKGLFRVPRIKDEAVKTHCHGIINVLLCMCFRDCTNLEIISLALLAELARL